MKAAFNGRSLGIRVKPNEGRITGSPSDTDWATPNRTPIPNRELVVNPKDIRMKELDSLPKGTAVLSNHESRECLKWREQTTKE